MRIKKAQVGKNLPKKSKKEEMVPSEMFPGKMIPKSQSNYATGKIAKMLESGKSKPAPKKATAPKKKMKDGGKAFPDLNKDGKVTKADILVGRGVIKAKKGVKMKAQGGTKVALRAGQLKRLGKLSAKNPAKAEQVGSKMVEKATRQSRGKEYLKKNLSELMPKSKYGSKTGKCRYGCK